MHMYISKITYWFPKQDICCHKIQIFVHQETLNWWMWVHYTPERLQSGHQKDFDLINTTIAINFKYLEIPQMNKKEYDTFFVAYLTLSYKLCSQKCLVPNIFSIVSKSPPPPWRSWLRRHCSVFSAWEVPADAICLGSFQSTPWR